VLEQQEDCDVTGIEAFASVAEATRRFTDAVSALSDD
jgi:hypothetical protein